MDKKLSFILPPIIDAYSGAAGNIAIQMSKQGYIPMIIENHFLITYYHDSSTGGFNWIYYKDEQGEFGDIHATIQEKGLVDALIELLDNAYYIHIMLDHYYIGGADAFQKYHKLHDCATIFGYNLKERIFYVADNFTYGKYMECRVTFDEVVLSRAYCSEYTALSKKYPERTDYTFTIEKVYCLLQGYIDGVYYHYSDKKLIKVEHDNDENTIYGTKVFQILFGQAQDIKNGFTDIRTFHVMCNHMNIGILLIEWFMQNDAIMHEYVTENDVLDSYRKFSEKMFSIRNLFIKLTRRYEEEKYARLLDNIKIIQEKELHLLKGLVEYIRIHFIHIN